MFLSNSFLYNFGCEDMRFFTSFATPIIAMTLLLGETCVTGLSLFYPRVDHYFSDYYITSRRSCWMPEPMAAKAATSLKIDHIGVSRLNQIVACYLLERGWSGVEAWGVWSNARNVTLELPEVVGKPFITLTLIGASPQNRQSIKVFLNDVSVGTFFVPNNRKSSILLRVPADPLGTLQISIEIRNLTRASKTDSRELGVGLVAIDRM